MNRLEILIISGLSGAGKSRAAVCLEDSGYYIVDNLPAEMMVKFAEFCAAAGGRYDRLAFVYDVRAGEPFTRLLQVVDQLRGLGLRCRLLFLEADTKTIINRYKETRRSHPLCGEGSIEDAVARERALLTLLGGGSGGGLHVTVLSFGFKNGLPPEADMVVDVRFLPNPYYVPELKRLTGGDEPVRAYVMAPAVTEAFWDKLAAMVDFLLPQYRQEGRTELVLAVGCTGGRHRSVAMAHRLAAHIGELGFSITESHRDMGR